MSELIAILDSEWSGLPKANLPDDDPTQPWLVQLSCKVVDGSYHRVSRFTRLIRPEPGQTIEEGARAIHGIDERLAYMAGVPLDMALLDLRLCVEEATVVVAYNMQPERGMISRSIARTGTGSRWWDQTARRHFDAMEAATPILRLPGPIKGHSGFKWPTLEEAVNFFAINTLPVDREYPHLHLGQPTGFWQSRHDAEEDIEATQFVFQAIREWKE